MYMYQGGEKEKEREQERGAGEGGRGQDTPHSCQLENSMADRATCTKSAHPTISEGNFLPVLHSYPA
jgi:hypothetical protein